ncbi:MAG: hypothetical protein ACTHYV_08765 [Psychroflexus sp.]|uniref:hypothetical protein n=1 Tax=Psychroflexus sp. S27 TaxID=1982757 RepID=UPI000C2B0FA2|nr:hypothetical protein [Psychroflexus sp. S27]PJX20126.1 hypothetical protein CAP47_11375 [Psychroflexus sp. S27]
MKKHNTSSFNTFTLKYRPWILKAVFEAGDTRSEAEVIERYVKKQKSRCLLEKLIDKDFEVTGKLVNSIRVSLLSDHVKLFRI